MAYTNKCKAELKKLSHFKKKSRLLELKSDVVHATPLT